MQRPEQLRVCLTPLCVHNTQIQPSPNVRKKPFIIGFGRIKIRIGVLVD